MQNHLDASPSRYPVGALGVPPTSVMRGVPGRMWLDATDRGWDDIALCGMEIEPNRFATSLRAHTLIAYLDGKPRLTREIGGREVGADMGPGSLVLKDVNTTGDWAWDQAKRTVLVFLSPYLLQSLASDIYGPRVGALRLRDCASMHDDVLLSLVHDLAREAESHEPGASVMVKNLAQQIAIHLIRRHADLQPQTDIAPQRDMFDSERRRHIVQFISSNLNQVISVSHLAERENLSLDRFSRMFRNTFDCSPQQHMRNLRLQRVLELMADPGLTLAEIAYETGFTDQSHLTRVFKSQHGTPPGLWRSRHASQVALAREMAAAAG